MSVYNDLERAIVSLSEGEIERNIEIIIQFLKDDERFLDFIVLTVDKYVENKVEVYNCIAVWCYENKIYDLVIPLLQEALKHDPVDKSTLVNLSQILIDSGEYQLARTYLSKVKVRDEEVNAILDRLTELEASNGILDLEQNDVEFTGERIVVNRLVKDQYSNILEEHIKRYEMSCQYAKGKVILDAACGAGYGSKMLVNAGAEMVYGVDISEESLISAKKDYSAPNIKFMYGDVNKLPFEDCSFDIVVSYETIEHIESGAKWIQESARLLKENGLFLVSTPNRTITNPGTYFNERPLNPHHQYEYTASEFVGALLKKYDIVELYGQTFSKDQETYYTSIMRQIRKMDMQFKPTVTIISESDKHSLIPLSEIKDMQPMYIVAVCRKK